MEPIRCGHMRLALRLKNEAECPWLLLLSASPFGVWVEQATVSQGCCCVQELAAAITKPGSALFQEIPEGSGCYQPSAHASVQSDSVDVISVFWTLGVVVAKAVAARACFPVRFTKCAFRLCKMFHLAFSIKLSILAC